MAIAARLLRRRFIFSSSSYLDFAFEERGFPPRDLALYRLGLRLADDLVVLIDDQARQVRSSLDRTAVVVRSIGERAQPQSVAPEAFLWLGRVMPNKRPLAYVELARSLPEAVFWMALVPRDDALLADVRRKAAGLPNLRLLDPLPREEALKLVDRAVAVVSTSRFEGMPMVFLEAWARGVPALTLEYDPDETVGRLGLGASARGSEPAFIAAARALWLTRLDRRDVADRCRRYIEDRHSPDVVAERWEQLVRKASVG